MPAEGGSQPAAQAAQPSANVRNSRHAFHSTRRVYNTIAKRSTLGNPLPRAAFTKRKTRKDGDKCEQTIFLPRNVRKAYNLVVDELVDAAPPVRITEVVYKSVEPGIDWSLRVPDLRCLWCQRSFIPFQHPLQLLFHLNTCHDMLHYKLPDPTASPLVVQVKLQRDSDPADNSGMQQNGIFEDTIFQKRLRTLPKHHAKNASSSTMHRRSGRSNPADADKRVNIAGASRNTNNPRPQRSRRIAPSYTFDDDAVDPVDSDSSAEYSASPRSRRKRSRADGPKSGEPGDDDDGDDAPGTDAMRRKSRAKARRTAGKRGTRGKPAFKTVAEAAASGRLFHSVVHNPLDMRQYALDGEQSDDDNELEKSWRFKLSCEAMCDVADTIAVEKMFMMLWNQFVQLEHRVDADRAYFDACLDFVARHGATVRRMRFEPTLVRHLNQLVRIGLLDAQNVHELLTRLPKRADARSSGGSGSGDAQFRFGEYVLRQAERRRQRKGRISDMERRPDDQV